MYVFSKYLLFKNFIADTIADTPISELTTLRKAQGDESRRDGWHAPGACTQVGSFISTAISGRQELAQAQMGYFLSHAAAKGQSQCQI